MESTPQDPLCIIAQRTGGAKVRILNGIRLVQSSSFYLCLHVRNLKGRTLNSNYRQLRLRVGLVIHFDQFFHRYVSIDLRGGKTGMTE